jgi:hypothetical protein
MQIDHRRCFTEPRIQIANTPLRVPVEPATS